MTQENKDLLLKDFRSRLPYQIKALYGAKIISIKDIDKDGIVYYYNDDKHYGYLSLSYIKPYLFPMSSMTPKQLFEVQEILGKEDVKIEEDLFRIVNHERDAFSYEEIQAVLDWFYKNHFDIFKLIPKGLAINCTNLNIY